VDELALEAALFEGIPAPEFVPLAEQLDQADVQ
jgi:hypothetical protein